MNRIVMGTVTTILVAACIGRSQSTQLSPEAAAKPLLLEKNEGELRTRRVRTDNHPISATQFMLKVSPKNNGSEHLVLGTEELLPAAGIRKHKHLTQDEILLIQSGTAHVWLGDHRNAMCTRAGWRSSQRIPG